MFDTSVLLYVDRFCPETYPTKEDMELFEQFVILWGGVIKLIHSICIS